MPVELGGTGGAAVDVEQASGLGGSERDEVAPGFVLHEGRRGIRRVTVGGQRGGGST